MRKIMGGGQPGEVYTESALTMESYRGQLDSWYKPFKLRLTAGLI